MAKIFTFDDQEGVVSRRKSQKKSVKSRAPRKKQTKKESKERKDKRSNYNINRDVDDRKEIFQSIRALAATKLSGWQRKEWEEKVRTELGAKAKKKQKMPIKMLIGIRKKRKHIETRREQCNKEQDVVTAKKKKKVVKKNWGKRWLNSQRFDGGVTKGVMNIRGLLE